MEKENVQVNEVIQVERGWWLNQADTINKKTSGNEKGKNGETRGVKSRRKTRGNHMSVHVVRSPLGRAHMQPAINAHAIG